MEKYKVFVERTFDCSQEELFDWLVVPEKIAYWFGPKGMKASSVQSDPIEGGRYLIDMEKDGVKLFSIRGAYLEVERPEKLVLSFSYRGLQGRFPDSKVVMNLERKGDQCLLKMVQLFDELPPEMDKRTEAWNYMFERLSNQI